MRTSSSARPPTRCASRSARAWVRLMQKMLRALVLRTAVAASSAISPAPMTSTLRVAQVAQLGRSASRAAAWLMEVVWRPMLGFGAGPLAAVHRLGEKVREDRARLMPATCAARERLSHLAQDLRLAENQRVQPGRRPTSGARTAARSSAHVEQAVAAGRSLRSLVYCARNWPIDLPSRLRIVGSSHRLSSRLQVERMTYLLDAAGHLRVAGSALHASRAITMAHGQRAASQRHLFAQRRSGQCDG